MRSSALRASLVFAGGDATVAPGMLSNDNLDAHPVIRLEEPRSKGMSPVPVREVMGDLLVTDRGTPLDHIRPYTSSTENEMVNSPNIF